MRQDGARRPRAGAYRLRAGPDRHSEPLETKTPKLRCRPRSASERDTPDLEPQRGVAGGGAPWKQQVSLLHVGGLAEALSAVVRSPFSRTVAALLGDESGDDVEKCSCPIPMDRPAPRTRPRRRSGSVRRGRPGAGHPRRRSRRCLSSSRREVHAGLIVRPPSSRTDSGERVVGNDSGNLIPEADAVVGATVLWIDLGRVRQVEFPADRCDDRESARL